MGDKRSFQERIKDLSEYRPNVIYKDGSFIFIIKYDKSWTVVEPQDDSVAYEVDKSKPNVYWYASTIENSDKLLDLIEETIRINKELEKKADLYREKVKELQELFLSDVSYDKLETITFVFQKPKKTVKKKQTKTTNQTEDKGNSLSDIEDVTEKIADVDGDKSNNNFDNLVKAAIAEKENKGNNYGN